jgi:ketosteroid isomerase-like protein
MSTTGNVDVVLEIFRTIETRDQKRFAALCHPDLELHWPPSLPYGGVDRGNVSAKGVGWGGTWGPLQPTEAERQLEPRVVADSGDEVVVLWRQRGVSPGGDRLDTPVLGLYVVRDGKLARGQMFYFDTAEVVSFLVNARADAVPKNTDADRK